MLDNGACSEVHVINSSESVVNSGIEVIERGICVGMSNIAQHNAVGIRIFVVRQEALFICCPPQVSLLPHVYFY